MWRAAGFLLVVAVLVFAVGFAIVLRTDRYPTRNAGGDPPLPVLVAKQPIPKGTPGSLVLSRSMYVATTLTPKELEVGAISDPAYLRGRTSVVDVLPGQQLTETNFTST